ncbi:hypothetical protein ANN_22933 [Periplaneta americana]|uniref:Uncharacterized protein n=1 Tax=Periplaneta americana TaxID=6978 RepID=A0ABQ8SK23_PERAM|nr:hypothetical protein ANN_22933 [Periplaneta americana]
MSPGPNTESYPAFARIGLRKTPEKPQPGNLPRPGFEPGPPGFAARRADRYSAALPKYDDVANLALMSVHALCPICALNNAHMVQTGMATPYATQYPQNGEAGPPKTEPGKEGPPVAVPPFSPPTVTPNGIEQQTVSIKQVCVISLMLLQMASPSTGRGPKNTFHSRGYLFLDAKVAFRTPNFLAASFKSNPLRAGSVAFHRSELLIKKIRREGVCAGDEKLESPEKNRQRGLLIIVDDMNRCILRRKIQEFYTVQKEVSTLKKLLKLAREAIISKVGEKRYGK